VRDDGGGDYKEPGEQGEKRRCLDETEISSGIHHLKASDCSHNTSDEDNEDPRPAKWRRLPSTNNTLILPDKLALVANDDYHPSRTS
jgi:hypothetical protein